MGRGYIESKRLVGNGVRPGLVERVTVAEQRAIGLEVRVTSLELSDREQARLSWNALALVIALAGTLATGLVEALKHLT